MVSVHNEIKASYINWSKSELSVNQQTPTFVEEADFMMTVQPYVDQVPPD
jgi:hypothetical protein